MMQRLKKTAALAVTLALSLLALANPGTGCKSPAAGAAQGTVCGG